VARRDATVRADFLRDLAAGRVTADRLARESKAHGLDLGEPYFAVSAVCDSGAADALEAHIRRSGASAERRTLQAVIDGRLFAVTARVPAAYEDVAIAIGPAALLSDAHASFAEADQALATARAFGVGGIVHLGALGPLPLVNEASALAARLGDRHLRELERRGASGREIEETVRILLELDRNVEATAARLHLHRNSIRYRVSRFHELTGLDLGRTQDLVTTWWLLSRRRASGS
jgi:DNA-binding PucR family transcriptional regulator